MSLEALAGDTLERCPNCRARLDAAPQCRRCGLDLTWLRALEDARLARVARAIRCLLEDDRAGAIADLDLAQSLRRDDLAAALLGLARQPR